MTDAEFCDFNFMEIFTGFCGYCNICIDNVQGVI